MSLEQEIEVARKQVVSDGYEMSFGEVMNLYQNREIVISPDFQRLFRWDPSRKTRFIESLLLGIPIPPIFVYQDESGIWELIDGLQRLSTVLEFAGLLLGENGEAKEPSTLEGTNFLPSLAGKRWEPSSEETGDGIGRSQQLQIKRARVRVEILKQESDPQAKYELFQRLNTGGASLSEQEVRNCIAVMINREFHEWLLERAALAEFQTVVAQTDTARERQSIVELALRFVAFRNIPYSPGLDVHEYLDDALFRLAGPDSTLNLDIEADVFTRTFVTLEEALHDRAFRKWDGNSFSGKFLMSLFEVVATGVAANIDAIEQLGEPGAGAFIEQRCKDLWNDPTFTRNNGAGIRGTTRLANLLPLGPDFFRP